MHATEIVGYSYDSEIFCSDCLCNHMIATGELSPGARGMEIETALEQWREANAFDDIDLHDSEMVPQALFADSDETHFCTYCNEWLNGIVYNDENDETVENCTRCDKESETVKFRTNYGNWICDDCMPDPVYWCGTD